MAKDIPVDKLKVAVNALNTMLDAKIKMITRKKSDIIADFKRHMDTFIEEDTTDQLPEECVDFYNDFIATEEDAEETPAPESKEKSPNGKKVSASKSGKDQKEKSSKTPNEKKAPKEKSSVERDEFGSSVNSKTHQFVVMISKKPMKMADIKSELGDSYYNFIRKHPESILKNQLGYFYVKGSNAEKLSLSMKVDEVKSNKDSTSKVKATNKDEKIETVTPKSTVTKKKEVTKKK